MWKGDVHRVGLFCVYLIHPALPTAPFVSYRSTRRFTVSSIVAMSMPCLHLACVALRWAGSSGPSVGLAVACLFVLHFAAACRRDENRNYDLEFRSTGSTSRAFGPVDAVARFLKSRTRERLRRHAFAGLPALLGLEESPAGCAVTTRFTAVCEAAGLETRGWRLLVREESLPSFKPMYDALNLRSICARSRSIAQLLASVFGEKWT